MNTTTLAGAVMGALLGMSSVLSCSPVPTTELSSFVGPGPGNVLEYELTGGGRAEGTVVVASRAACGSGCLDLESTTTIANLPAATTQERIWVTGEALLSAPLRDGRVHQAMDTLLLRLPLRTGTSWLRQRRIQVADPASVEGKDEDVDEKGPDESESCRIVRVEGRELFARRRVVVSVACETPKGELGLVTSTREEFAEGIGLISMTEEFKAEAQEAII